jgi:hypothetical protein
LTNKSKTHKTYFGAVQNSNREEDGDVIDCFFLFVAFEEE